MILRQLEQIIEQKLTSGKAIIVLGPRQTGKTTLLKKIVMKHDNSLVLNCDDPFVRDQLQNANTTQIRKLIGSDKIVFIDEAQRVKNIGITLKIIIDEMKDVILLVSGSSALEISSEINEPLTGRKWEYMLYPVCWKEFYSHAGRLTAMQQLEQRMVFGMYPEVINFIGNETEVLMQIAGSYLFKDLLAYNGIRKPELLEKLLKSLAFQIGNMVSYNELANMLQVDKNTISTYIDLLEKAFVIFRVQPFSRNLRKEISTSRKIYFYDTGIRNTLINNLNPLEYRNDVGALWENFIIAERMKYLHYQKIYASTWFWRTQQQQEIDYLEECGGVLSGYEFKWNPEKKYKTPSVFKDTYPNSEVQVINRHNFLPFVGVE
ncbi:MAG: ATPase [Odoribacter sp.]|nr:ATPase [Odoribacter sp.]